MTGEGSGQRRRHNAGGTLGEHSVIPPPDAGGTAVSAMPCAAPIASLSLGDCRGGGKHMEGKGREGTDSTVLLGMGFLDIAFLKRNEATRETRSVKTPLNQIAQ